MLLLGAKWSACFDRKLKWCGCGESNGHYDIFVFYINKTMLYMHSIWKKNNVDTSRELLNYSSK